MTSQCSPFQQMSILSHIHILRYIVINAFPTKDNYNNTLESRITKNSLHNKIMKLEISTRQNVLLVRKMGRGFLPVTSNSNDMVYEFMHEQLML